MGKTDRFTVEKLQLRAPHVSEGDLTYLKELVHENILFPEITEVETRESIWNNVSQTACLILSLYTLFEDLKLLNPCMKIIKALIDLPIKGSLYDMMFQHFSSTNQAPREVVIQYTELDFSTYPGSEDDQFRFGYRQLYLFALRHFPQMVRECPKKETDQPRPNLEEPDQVTWHRFAVLADQLGFSSKAIRELKDNDPYTAEARNYFLKRYPLESYTLDQQLLENCMQQIAKAGAAAVKKSREYSRPPVVTQGPGEQVARRYGRFFQAAHEYKRNYLFMDVLYNTADKRGRGITSLFVRRSTFFAFFGRYTPGRTAEAPGGRPPGPDKDRGGDSRSVCNVNPSTAQTRAETPPRTQTRAERPPPQKIPRLHERSTPAPSPSSQQASDIVCLYPYTLNRLLT
jgi:hypothetical protein